MTEHWQVEGPRVIDVGGEQQRVTKVIVAIVGGHVDVLGHAAATGAPTSEDGDTIPGGPHGARVQVTSVQGLPLRVSWDGSTLRVMHVKETDETVLDALKRLIGARGVPTAVVTVSVPAQWVPGSAMTEGLVRSRRWVAFSAAIPTSMRSLPFPAIAAAFPSEAFIPGISQSGLLACTADAIASR